MWLCCGYGHHRCQRVSSAYRSGTHACWQLLRQVSRCVHACVCTCARMHACTHGCVRCLGDRPATHMYAWVWALRQVGSCAHKRACTGARLRACTHGSWTTMCVQLGVGLNVCKRLSSHRPSFRLVEPTCICIFVFVHAQTAQAALQSTHACAHTSNVVAHAWAYMHVCTKGFHIPK